MLTKRELLTAYNFTLFLIIKILLGLKEADGSNAAANGSRGVAASVTIRKHAASPVCRRSCLNLAHGAIGHLSLSKPKMSYVEKAKCLRTNHLLCILLNFILRHRENRKTERKKDIKMIKF